MSFPEPVDHELQIISAALKGMSEMPMRILDSLQFYSSGINPANPLNESRFYERLGKAETNDLLVDAFKRQLQRWDYSENGDWYSGTEKNTKERRVLIYELLGMPEQIRKICDDKFPPYLPYEAVTIIAEDHIRWYDSNRRKLHSFYWDAYCRHLREVNLWPENSMQNLDESTLKIVERLSDPESTEQFQSKGLVVGYVQSGKTANFTGVISRAADAGYRLVMVLAGTMNILRRQTQRRLDKELIGVEFLEDEYITDEEYPNFLAHGIRPSDHGYFDWHRLTNLEDDYRSLQQGIESLEFHKIDNTKPFYHPVNLHPSMARIMVVKKNPTILKRIARDLGRIRAKLQEIPALVIDDESDQASLNTKRPKKEQKERTETNKAIVELLKQLPRAQYVGYTATPFANVFVDPSDAEDLFPKDFIISLRRPTGYMGAREFHDFVPNKPTDYSSNERAFIRSVEGEDAKPDNLQKAIDSFILSGAIKLFRRANDSALAYRHHTMLVHTSSRNVEQKQMARLIEKKLSTSGYEGGAGIPRLEELFKEDFEPVTWNRHPEYSAPKAFNELLPFIGECLSNLREGDKQVLIVNMEHEDDNPDFDKIPIWKILVGGAKLSRGYTIEGLTVSYYRRKASAADTLMQMGRWFGFRKGYEDLIRLFIGRNEPLTTNGSIDLYLAFEGVCRDEEDFRAQLDRYAMPEEGSPITPRQVPPLVPAHLLRPTATNKMYNAIIKFKNFSERWVQSVVAPYKKPDMAHNRRVAQEMLQTTDLKSARFEFEDDGNSERFDLLVGILEPKKVLEFVKKYRWIDARPIMQHEIEFMSGNHGDIQLDRWLFMAPQIAKGKLPFKVGTKTFNVVERSRVGDNAGFQGYSDPVHILAAEHLTGKIHLSNPNDALQQYVSSRQGVFLFYPICDVKKDKKEITMGFYLLFPKNGIRNPISFGVYDPAKLNAIVVPR